MPVNPFDIPLDQIHYGLPITALVLALGDIQLKTEASAKAIEALDVQTAKPKIPETKCTIRTNPYVLTPGNSDAPYLKSGETSFKALHVCHEKT